MLQELLGPWDLLERAVLEDPLVPLVRLERQESLDQQGLPDGQALPDHVVLLDLPDPLDLPVVPEP